MRRFLYAGMFVGVCGACSTEEGATNARSGAVRQAAASTCAPGDGAKTPFAAGAGSVADPYVICSLAQLDRVRGAYLVSNFALHTDLDAAITSPASTENAGSAWSNGGAGFDPIGNCGANQTCNDGDDVAFTGTFDGLDHTISNLFIARTAQSGVGLFGKVSSGGTGIKNLRLKNLDVSGKSYVGGLVGYLVASVSRCASSGIVRGSLITGGLVAQIGTSGGPSVTRSITASWSACTVSGTDIETGGLVGNVEWGSQVRATARFKIRTQPARSRARPASAV